MKVQGRCLLILAPGKIRFIETVPDQLQAVLGNADAAVLYGDEYLVPFFCGFNLDNGIGVGKFDGIVHQVVEYLLYFAHIRVHGKLFAGKDKLNGDMLLLAGASKDAAVLRMMELTSKSDFSRTMPLVFRLFRVSRLLVSLVSRSVSF